MGTLSIISVTGAVPHSACHFEYDGIPYANGWLGFGPSAHRRPASRHGQVFTDDESYRLNHGISFELPDTRMYRAAQKTAEQYGTGAYVVCVRDCVSFSADVARRVGLGVPLVNMTPYGLIQILAIWNDYVRKW